MQLTERERELTGSVSTIVAFVAGREEQAAVLRAAGARYVVKFRSDPRSLIAAVREPNVAHVVWEVVAGSDHLAPAVCAALESAGHGAKLFLIVDLSKAASRQLIGLSAHLPFAEVAIRAHDNINEQIVRWLKGRMLPSGHPAILEALPQNLHGRIADIVLSAAVAGRRRVALSEFTRVCGIPLRTLEWTLARSSFPTPSRLLGLMSSLHTAWRIDVLGCNAATAAAAAGFPNARALAKFVEGHTSLRLRDLSHADAFKNLRGRVATILADACMRRVRDHGD